MDTETGNINSFIEEVFYPFSEEDQQKLDLGFLKDVQIGDNECLYFLDLYQNKIIYKKGFCNLLGYEEEKITFAFLINNIHPDDADIVQRLTKVTILYSLNHPQNSINNQLFITYRHKTINGDYIKILNHISIFNVNKKGVLKTLLIRLLDISFLDNSNNVNWTFKADQLDEEAFKKRVYKYTHNIFTMRELELIHEIVKGSHNKQIAINFNISEQTVATHRKNILRKSDCHNFNELEIYCRGKGIL